MKMIEKYLRFEYLFVIIALIMGWRMAYTNPPWQSNDEDRHFYNAYYFSEGKIKPSLKNGKVGQILPENLVQTVRSFQGIPFSKEAKVSRTFLESISKKKIIQSKKTFNANPSAVIMPIGYLPSTIGIWFARMTNQNLLEVGYWARLFSLLSFVLIVFWAIKLIPEGFKAILFITSLAPMTLYQAASVTYDSLTLALLILFLAYVVKLYKNENQIKISHVIALILIASIQRLTKDGYFPLYFTALVLPRARFEDQKAYWVMISGLLFASFVPSYLWGVYVNSWDIPRDSIRYFQKDFRFDRAASLKYNLQDPLNFVVLTIQNIFVQGKMWLRGMIGRFGYSYTLLPAGQILTWYILILISASHKRSPNSKRFTLVIGSIAILSTALIIFGWFMSSPIGARYIYGLQGRYLTPILPFLIVGLINPNLFKLRLRYWKIGLSVCTLILLNMSISFMDDYFFNP